jgi:hypothetical protein
LTAIDQLVLICKRVDKTNFIEESAEFDKFASQIATLKQNIPAMVSSDFDNY